MQLSGCGLEVFWVMMTCSVVGSYQCFGGGLDTYGILILKCILKKQSMRGQDDTNGSE
jgi:hypothetical protein